MKQRFGFVSNSSSSSFLLFFKEEPTLEYIEQNIDAPENVRKDCASYIFNMWENFDNTVKNNDYCMMEPIMKEIADIPDDPRYNEIEELYKKRDKMYNHPDIEKIKKEIFDETMVIYESIAKDREKIFWDIIEDYKQTVGPIVKHLNVRDDTEFGDGLERNGLKIMKKFHTLKAYLH